MPLGDAAGAMRLEVQGAGPHSNADWAVRGALWRARLSSLEAHLRGATEPRDAGIVDLLVRRRLPSTAVAPLHHGHVLDWMPASGAGLPPSAVYVVDSEGPRRFPIATWISHFDDYLAVGIQLDKVRPETLATFRVTAPCGVRPPVIEVRHVGWLDLAWPREQAVALRSRFEATWRASLEGAALPSSTPGRDSGRGLEMPPR